MVIVCELGIRKSWNIGLTLLIAPFTITAQEICCIERIFAVQIRQMLKVPVYKVFNTCHCASGYMLGIIKILGWNNLSAHVKFSQFVSAASQCVGLNS